MRSMLGALGLAVVVGCADGGGGGGDGGDGQDCTTDWECVNSVCECADGTPCDDPDDCDVKCEVCS